MPHKRKERGAKKSKRSGEERKQKVKDERAVKLSQKSRNFAFCACPNFESCNLASGTKASPVFDL